MKMKDPAAGELVSWGAGELVGRSVGRSVGRCVTEMKVNSKSKEVTAIKMGKKVNARDEKGKVRNEMPI